MPVATVLIPTHNHVETLRHAVAGVQAQGLQDFELFIVGDGVGDSTRKVVAELSAADRRLRFFDFAKGPGQGETNRHRALQHARGRFVAYLGDDDFWMPNHLETLHELLAACDFGHTLQVSIDEEGQIFVAPADLQNSAFRNRMLTELFNRFDFTFTGHTLEAYRRLPHGWRTTPPEFPWTDLYMWRQFLAEPWCRARSAMVPTCINTWSHRRPGLSDRERAADLAYWRAQVALPNFREALWRKIARRFAEESIGFELEAIGQSTEAARLKAEQEAAQARWQTEYEFSRSGAARYQAELEAQVAALTAQLTAMRNSTSWWVTQPLRRIRQLAEKCFGK